MAENKDLDRELNLLENSIRQLKRDYELFFAGQSKRPPTDDFKKIEQSVKKWGVTQGFTFAQRFRYNTITARFSSYSDLWSKQLRMKEEGRLPGMSTRQEMKPRPAAPAAPVAAPVAQKVPAESGMERVFKDYVSAREKTGENNATINLQKFSQQIAAQKESLISKYNCKDVEFYVTVENGRTKLKAKPIK